jgi:hypothetical protein
MLGDAQIGTVGNLLMIHAQIKQGKSAVCGGIMAAAMGGKGDMLGFSANNEEGKAVIHFDTEQSVQDWDGLVRRALARARRSVPAFFRSYHIRNFPIKDRREALRFELECARETHGGIHCVLIDGVADMLTDPNNIADAFGLVHELLQLSIEFETLIICVLHENHGSESGKTRGHLGSELERKAETNLRLQKDDDGVTTIYSERSRHTHIPKTKGQRFHWDDDLQMHVSTGTDPRRTEAHREAAQFYNGNGMRHCEALEAMGQKGIKLETARSRHKKYEKLKVIEKRSKNGVEKWFLSELEG